MKKHNNFVFKRTLALLGLFDKDDIIRVFQSVDYDVSKSQIEKWKSIKDDSKQPMPNSALVAFFNGLDTLSRDGYVVCGYNFGAGNE